MFSKQWLSIFFIFWTFSVLHGEVSNSCSSSFGFLRNIKQAFIGPSAEPRPLTPKQILENEILFEKERLPGPAQKRFKTGYGYWKYFKTKKGDEVLLTGRIIPKGQVLHLYDVTLRKVKFREKIFEQASASPSEVLSGLAEVVSEAEASGFEYFVMHGERVTGARAGKSKAEQQFRQVIEIESFLQRRAAGSLR